jgi:uncharacterized protein YggE
MNARTRLPLAAAAAALLVAAFLAVRPDSNPAPQPAQAADAPALTAAEASGLSPFLRFTGTGSVNVKPDRAEISATVQSSQRTSELALDETSRRMAKVIAKMKALGIADADLRTEGAQTYQEYDTKNWTATQTLTVTVRKLDQAGALLTAANAAGAQQVWGPTFSVEDQAVAYREAIAKAITDARAKADAAAAQIGVHVTGVVSVDETNTGGEPPIMYAAETAADATGAAPVPVEQGTQQVSTTLTVVFAYSR